MTAAWVLVSCLVVGIGAFVAWNTARRGRWGIRLGKLNCPRCLRRVPQTPGFLGLGRFFGGGTCPACKTLVNKWGREIMPDHAYRVKAARAQQK